MPSERVQRQIDRMLDEAESALAANEWELVRARCRAVLAIDPANEDAPVYLEAAVRALGEAPPDAAVTASGDGGSGARRDGGGEFLERAAELVSRHISSGAGRQLRGLFLPQQQWRVGATVPVARSSLEALVANVLAERLDVTQFAAPTGTVTILFTDIEASTELNARLGDQRWVQLLREHDDLVRGAVAGQGGFEVKSQGDGFMVAFGSATAAVRCAIDVQRAISARNEEAETGYLVRIGLHTGEPVLAAGDFYGTQVVMASRIAHEASGGEVLVSSLLHELVVSGGEFAFEARAPVTLKGLEGEHVMYAVRWE